VLTIGPGGGLADVVVSIVGIREGRELPERATPPVVDQVRCRYVPHVLAVTLGERVLFRNGDPVLHNVRAEWEGGELWFNVGQPRSGDASAHVADRTGVARLLCDAGHPWMLAWVHVFDHPYHAVTRDDGAFEIVGVPPGEHRVRFWHAGFEVVGTASARPTYGDAMVIERVVTVPEDGEVVVDVTLPAAVAP
jgi:plastocyanin